MDEMITSRLCSACVTTELIVIHRSLPLMVLSTQSCVNCNYVDNTQSSMELIRMVLLGRVLSRSRVNNRG